MSFFQEHRWSILIAILAVIVIAIVGVLLFRRPVSNTPAQSSISVVVQAPQQSASGSQVVYQVTVSNNASNGIKGVTLDMVYPNGFTFQDANPTPSQLQGGEFAVPDLNPGQNAAIMIKGILVGNAGESKQVSAVVHYEFTNFNSQYSTNAIARTQITNSNLGLSIDGPTTTSSTQNDTYTVTYTNTTAQAMQGLLLTMTIPQDFVVSSSTPALDQNQSITIPTLAANQSGTVTIHGTFAKASPGAQETLSVSVQGTDPTTNQNLVLATTAYQVSVSSAPLQLSATVSDNSQGSSSATNVVNPGDTLSYDVHYLNASTTAVTNVVVTASIGGSAVDLTSVQAQNASIQDNTVVWNGSQVSAFASLAPQASGDLTMQFQILNPATKGSDKDMQVQVGFGITSQEYPQGFQLQTPAQKIGTQLSLADSVTATAGAMPPAVGANSTYQVTISLTNATNDVQNGVVTLSLPQAQGFDTTSINADQAAHVKYNSSTHALTWTVADVPAHAGAFVAAPKLQFSETITPSITDQGNTVKLLSGLSFSGTDAFTSQTITATAPDLSTGDAGNGTVQ